MYIIYTCDLYYDTLYDFLFVPKNVRRSKLDYYARARTYNTHTKTKEKNSTLIIIIAVLEDRTRLVVGAIIYLDVYN